MERLTDEQINKAEKSTRITLNQILSGKVAKSIKEVREGNKKVIFFGPVTVRQVLRIIFDLRYYKARCEELEARSAIESNE